MTNSANDIIECESVSLRVAPGEYFNFPVVDNKGLFRHFYKTSEEFKFQVQSSEPFEEDTIYALYGKKGDFAYLICAWDKKEEINDSALEILKSSVKFSYLLN
ncbi:hypothetical protein [Pantoea cypripedii]|uniref:Uncharacterized protein n=1 Tax=Pantoea cypripedii TaxID=55209 RepID=A0A6B9G2T0_PANCY|nr:hypothetical protein [Pantoea cypripedii]QGY29050.1 hypothetical protein CUN67_08955 [Pantoea cypripedii]